MSNIIVDVKNLETTFFLKSGPFKAVNNISYKIHEGETLGIVGESGCGKSVTSFSLMQLIEKPGKITGGEFHLNGRDLFKCSESEMEDIREILNFYMINHIDYRECKISSKYLHYINEKDRKSVV